MRKWYPYIEFMKIFAAICIVAMNISPFSKINFEFNMMFIQVVCKLAFPFFMMMISFYLFHSRYLSVDEIKKTYLSFIKGCVVSIVIYIIFIILNRYFIQSIITDQIFYILSFFPSVMIGFTLILILKTYFSQYISLIITIIFYIVGVIGNDYNVISLISINSFLIECLYHGIFFVPLLMMLATMIQEKYKKKWMFYLLFLISFFIMCLEVRYFHNSTVIQLNDMYFLLPIVMYFLFSLLACYQDNRCADFSNISFWIIMIHPLMLVNVIMIGNYLDCLPLIQNNFIQFISVLFYSIVFACIMNKQKLGCDTYEKCHV